MRKWQIVVKEAGERYDVSPAEGDGEEYFSLGLPLGEVLAAIALYEEGVLSWGAMAGSEALPDLSGIARSHELDASWRGFNSLFGGQTVWTPPEEGFWGRYTESLARLIKQDPEAALRASAAMI